MIHHGCRSILQFFADAHAAQNKNFCWKNNWHTVLGQCPLLENRWYQFSVQIPVAIPRIFDSVNWVVGPET